MDSADDERVTLHFYSQSVKTEVIQLVQGIVFEYRHQTLISRTVANLQEIAGTYALLRLHLSTPVLSERTFRLSAR